MGAKLRTRENNAHFQTYTYEAGFLRSQGFKDLLKKMKLPKLQQSGFYILTIIA